MRARDVPQSEGNVSLCACAFTGAVADALVLGLVTLAIVDWTAIAIGDYKIEHCLKRRSLISVGFAPIE